MLLQISEPGLSPRPHQLKRAAGIDLGTTNSLVATVRSSERVTLTDEDGRDILPSIVRYTDEGVEVGVEAKASLLEDAENTLMSVKRLMGRSVNDVDVSLLPYRVREGENGTPFITTRRGEVTPVQVSAEILRALSARAREALGGPLDGVVITVPAYFDDAQRQATKDAARLAGMNVMRLLNEPTAAAVAYGLDEKAEGVIAVYDLGGGTFDISILRLKRGVFEVLSTGGDSALGGDDFDLAIARWCVEQWGLNASDLDGRAWRHLQEASKKAKEQLASDDQVDIKVEIQDQLRQAMLTRVQMDALLAPLVQKTLRACRKALRDAQIAADEIAEVVMVGGSTRTLSVRGQVAEFFGCEPLTSIDPDKVVALGAAAQADVLIGNKRDADMLLLDVIPLSLGLETMGGLAERVIDRNTVIPVARAQEFTTFKDGQTAMMIHVVQGERELVSDCRSLARFELHGIPPLAAGAARIRVAFQVDADGLLSVSAEETTSGVKSSVVVKPSYGLSEEEISTMLSASQNFAAEDMAARALAEQQVEADRLLEALRSALIADKHLLSEEELLQLEVGMEAVRQLRDSVTDHSVLSAAIEKLSQESDYFATRRMDRSIHDALAGHRVDEF
ncbi:Fe-S protein assembly chaperone HscA [Pokkaliibacter sp. CJK22405]|uniref:Fe-S protein assembly chaperone HscA n=1 Tax=Pokkaliibacter sp. CJK22405 TaxID=3384615 RepID=UPI003984F57A